MAPLGISGRKHPRRTIHILLFSLLVLGNTENNGLRGQDQGLPNSVEINSCQCGEIFDALVAKIKANYAGYAQAIPGKREAEFRRFAVSMRSRAKRTTPEECVVVLQDFLHFFRDGHLFINQSPQLTDVDVDRLTKQARQTHLSESDVRHYLEVNTQRLDPIEGLWYNRDGHRFGIIRDIKGTRRDFVAVMLSEDVDRWTAGQVKAKFSKLSDGSYTNVFYSSRHYPLHLRGYSRGLLGGAKLLRNGQLLHMPPITWGKSYPKLRTSQILLIPLTHGVRQFGSTTLQLLSFPCPLIRRSISPLSTVWWKNSVTRF